MTITGGFPPYDVIWYTYVGNGNPLLWHEAYEISGQDDGEDLMNLPKGVYSVEIYDALCGTYFSERFSLVCSCNSESYTVETTANHVCINESGSIELTIDLEFLGDFPLPYEAEWVNLDNNEQEIFTINSSPHIINDLDAGHYEITIFYANKECSLTVYEQLLDVSITVSADVQNAHNLPDLMCQNGAIDLHVEGGIGPFSYSWNIQEMGQPPHPQDVSNLGPGEYCVMIYDEYCGTQIEECFTIICCEQEELVELNLELIIENATQDENCRNGSIELPASNEDGPILFEWYIQEVEQGEYPNFVDGLQAGQYCVTAHTNSCHYEHICFEINCCPALPTILADCSESTWEIILEWPSTPEYLVQVISENGGPLGDPIIEGSTHTYFTQENGVHFIFFSGIEGCEFVREVNISPRVNVIEIADISDCAQQEAIQEGADPSCDGFFVFQVPYVGENMEVIVLDQTGEEVQGIQVNGDIYTINGICESGSYQIIVTDPYGCEDIEYIEICCCNNLVRDISEPYYKSVPGDCYEGGLRLTSVEGELTHIYTSGANDGAIDIRVIGGLQELIFLWSGPEGYESSNEDIQDLIPGIYCVTVSEDGYCSEDEISECFEIRDCSITDIQIDGNTTNTYTGCDIGAISIDISGGREPYLVEWSNDVIQEMVLSSATIENLSTGNYSVTVTDDSGKGCEEIQTFQITETTAPFNVNSNIYHTCPDYSYGEILLSTSNGVSPYLYDWSNGQSGSYVGNLGVGTFNVTITDSRGCFTTRSYTISDSESIIQEEYMDDCEINYYCNDYEVPELRENWWDVSDYGDPDCRFYYYACEDYYGNEVPYFPNGAENPSYVFEGTYEEVNLNSCTIQEYCWNNEPYGSQTQGELSFDVHFSGQDMNTDDCYYCFEADICVINGERSVVEGSISDHIATVATDPEIECTTDQNEDGCELEIRCYDDPNDPDQFTLLGTECFVDCYGDGGEFLCDDLVSIAERARTVIDQFNVIDTTINNFFTSQLPPDLQLRIFPNPFISSINLALKAPRATAIEIELYDVNGQLALPVMSNHVHKGNNIISIENTRLFNLPSGTYILIVKSHGTYQPIQHVIIKTSRP